MASDHRRVLVLPETQDRPSSLAQRFRLPFITLAVAGNLRQPIVPVANSGALPVLGTAVPEASVDEDRDSGSGEGDVDCASLDWDQSLDRPSAAAGNGAGAARVL